MSQDRTQFLKQRVLLEARTWVGTSFRHQGRAKKTFEHPGGVDCIGLLVGVARELQLRDEAGKLLHDYDMPNYSRIGIGERLIETLEKHFYKTDSIAPSNVLLFAFAGQPQHLGIIGEDKDGLTLIHAYDSNGKVVEHGLSDKWLKRAIGVYQWRF